MNTFVRKSFARILVLALVAMASLALCAVPVAEATSGGFYMYSWGNNGTGQLGLGNSGSANRRYEPTRIGSSSDWVTVASGANISAAINAQGQLFVWGAPWTANQMGQGANPSPGSGNIMVPTRVGTASNWTFVAVRSSTAAAINDQGHLYAWGTGLGNNANVPTRIFPNISWKRISVHANLFAAISEQGHLYTWGSSGDGQLGRPTSPTPSGTPGRIAERTDWADVSIGNSTVLALTEGGELYSWGLNDTGQIGRIPDAANPSNRPGRVGTASNWISMGITTGNTAAAINSAGELYTWGSSESGQLGRPATLANPNYLPGRVGDDSNFWVFVTSANTHFLAFNGDYELWSWGNNGEGQLGIGTGGGYEDTPQKVLQSYGFSGAARGGGQRSIMLMFTQPVGHTLSLEKQLQKPAGTPVPDLSFSFTFTPHSFNGDTTDLVPLPTIPTRTVTISDANTSAPNTPSAGITTTANSVDALAGVQFPQVGIYAWTIAEVQSAAGIGANSNVVFSQANYMLRVYVGSHETQPGQLAIRATTIHRLIDSEGDVVNPPYKTRYLRFENIYARTTTGTQDCDGALTISKTVVGRFVNLATPFNFQITLTRTALCPPNRTFTGQIFEGSTPVGTPITFTTDVAQTVALRHNQRIVFDEVLVGTRFTATELTPAGFTASAVLYVNGVLTAVPSVGQGVALPLGGPHTIGADLRNSAAFTNTYADPTPTGLTTGSFPYAAILVILGVTAAAITVKRRKDIEMLAL